jgi:hypothetical protein
MTIWENVVNNHFNSISNKSTGSRITYGEYENWHKQSLFDNLCGVRYGQSFCNTFSITDNILFHVLDHTQADKYIREHYIVQY